MNHDIAGESTTNQDTAVAAPRYLGQRDTNIRALHKIHACSDAIAWVRSEPDQTPQVLWNACEDYAWLAYLLATTKEQRSEDLAFEAELHLLDMLLDRTDRSDPVHPALRRCIKAARTAPWNWMYYQPIPTTQIIKATLGEGSTERTLDVLHVFEKLLCKDFCVATVHIYNTIYVGLPLADLIRQAYPTVPSIAALLTSDE